VVVITAVLHEIFDRLGRASDTGKSNALCFTEITTSHRLFNRAMEPKISALMKEDMTTKVGLEYFGGILKSQLL